MRIVDELFLLLRRDDGKAVSAFSQNGYGLAAAVITDLIVAERVTLSDHKDPRVSVMTVRATGHPALDAALVRLEQRSGKKLSSLVTDRRLAVEGEVAGALAAQGIVGIEEKQAWGLVPAKYPTLNPSPERQIRERLRAVLAGATPSTNDATVLSILQGLTLASKVLAEESGGLSRRDLKRRIQEVSTQIPAGDAVTKAVEAMNTAVMAVMVVAAVGSAGT